MCNGCLELSDCRPKWSSRRCTVWWCVLFSYCCFLQGKACSAGGKRHVSCTGNKAVTPCLQGRTLPRKQRPTTSDQELSVCWLPVSWARRSRQRVQWCRLPGK